jgi:histidinol dehydrogenase
VRDFQKASSVVHVTREGLARLSGPVASLAGYEGFVAHRLAVTHRGGKAGD